jgi:hypothetical protein
MKKLIVLALLVVGLTAFAQEKKGHHKKNKMERFSPEQQNQLELKKMTLELDLNADQQKAMSKIIAEKSVKREAMKAEHMEKMKKPTADERFEMKNKMLDEQIAMKEKMRKILNPEQFKKWENKKGDRKEMMHHREMTNYKKPETKE